MLLAPARAPNNIQTSGGGQSNTNGHLLAVRVRECDHSTMRPIDLPMTLESVAFLEHLGFTREKAEEVFSRYQCRDQTQDSPTAFLDFAYEECGKL